MTDEIKLKDSIQDKSKEIHDSINQLLQELIVTETDPRSFFVQIAQGTKLRWNVISLDRTTIIKDWCDIVEGLALKKQKEEFVLAHIEGNIECKLVADDHIILSCHSFVCKMEVIYFCCILMNLLNMI